jgi:hypothetical protein
VVTYLFNRSDSLIRVVTFASMILCLCFPGWHFAGIYFGIALTFAASTATVAAKALRMMDFIEACHVSSAGLKSGRGRLPLVYQRISWAT